MAETLINAIGDLTRIQRWNASPRIEIWTEAENIACATHIAYGLGKLRHLSNAELEHLFFRSLLKSLNKHYLSDILVDTRIVMRELDENLVWPKLVDHAAKQTAELFPSQIAKEVEGYMTYEGTYEIKGKNAPIPDEIEHIIKYAQYKVALRECQTNSKVYDQYYEDVIARIRKKITDIPAHDDLDQSYKELKKYPQRIENLKHLRRWNLINRSVQTSVLGHTFIVAFLALLISKLCQQEPEAKLPHDGCFQAILRALFHDVPETFTGDIITPVKSIIAKESPHLIEDVEEKMLGAFMNELPLGVQQDIKRHNLLKELQDPEPFSVDSLVKACDRLGIILEYLFEKDTGRATLEMTKAYNKYISKLQNSEWRPVREFCTHVLLEHPKPDIYS